MTEKKIVVEIMPDCWRDSHRAARNWGEYPHNGAERYAVDPAEVEDLIEPEYNHVVQGADPSDYGPMS